MRGLGRLVFVFVSTHVWAGNGSVGVGSGRVPVSECLSVRGKVSAKDGVVRDLRTGEALLKFSKMGGEEAQRFWRSSVETRLGTALGREFQPEIGENRINSWAVCAANGKSCEKIEALSSTNSQVAVAIGTLANSCATH